MAEEERFYFPLEELQESSVPNCTLRKLLVVNYDNIVEQLKFAHQFKCLFLRKIAKNTYITLNHIKFPFHRSKNSQILAVSCSLTEW